MNKELFFCVADHFETSFRLYSHDRERRASSFGSSHREFSEIFAFVRVVPRRLAPPAQLVVEPHQQVPDGLGAGDDVERGRQRPALVEVAHPQLGASELPLDVGVVLRGRRGERGDGLDPVHGFWRRLLR